MNEPSPINPSPFNPRVVAALAAVLIGLFAASLLLSGSSRHHDDENLAGPSTYSRSAVGHLGFFDLLRKLDYRAIRGEHDILAQVGTNGILVLAEPATALRGGASNNNPLGAETILLILPKWYVWRNPERDGWIGAAQPLQTSEVRSVLTSVAGAGEIVRVDKPSAFQNSLAIPRPTIAAPVQLIKNSKLRPIVSTAEGILVGELKLGRRRIWVLADPDPIENHGIGNGDNLAFATAIMYAMLADKPGRVVFDETLHGIRHPQPSIFKFLLEFPFNLVTLQIVAAVALLLMASMGRFGAPQNPDRILQAGKRDLISNAANLIDHAGHHAAILQRYITMVLQDTGRLLRAPRHLNDSELAAWLDRTGSAGGRRSNWVAALGRVASRSQDLVLLLTEARTIHRYRKDILNGVSGRLDDH
jgi:hypothetical protein